MTGEVEGRRIVPSKEILEKIERGEEGWQFKEVSASDILDAIEKGDDVKVDSKVIRGDLDLRDGLVCSLVDRYQKLLCYGILEF